MRSLHTYSLLIIIVLPLLGCQKSINLTTEIDNKSYINDFELLQENANNQTTVKILSPNAIFDPQSNDIEILESSIEIFNKNGQDFKVKSGNSNLNNLTNSIRVFNNVLITFPINQDYFITTDSFEWDLNTSVININNAINFYFDNTRINASNGFYNISSGIMNIDNSEFSRNVYNTTGDEEYQVQISSEFAKWRKKENTLEFLSDEKQVETTIDILLTE